MCVLPLLKIKLAASKPRIYKSADLQRNKASYGLSHKNKLGQTVRQTTFAAMSTDQSRCLRPSQFLSLLSLSLPDSIVKLSY